VAGDLELGAEQLVIVRNAKAKQDLLLEMPEFKDVQIMTVLESKGLEYSDVFIFNFFQVSELLSQFDPENMIALPYSPELGRNCK
jgi:ATP-dependent exoDNAse (exonuclease V) beta subunit